MKRKKVESLWLRVERAGFSLVEVTIAVGVAGFCLLAIFGLLPIGLKSNQAAINQTLGNSILTSVATDLRNTPSTAPRGLATNSPQFQIPLPANPVTTPTSSTLYFSENGQTNTADQARFRLTVTFPTNGPAAHSATLAHLRFTWPAAASLANASGSVDAFVALDRN
jgi:uncharacterized protein (TIGR02598 family)